MNKKENPTALHERISQLTLRLESEVAILRTQDGDQPNTTSDCNQLVDKVCAVYKRGMDQMHTQYRENLIEVHKELNYFKELSDSQQLMMKSKVEYIKELEARHKKIKPEGST